MCCISLVNFAGDQSCGETKCDTLVPWNLLSDNQVFANHGRFSPGDKSSDGGVDRADVPVAGTARVCTAGKSYRGSPTISSSDS